MKHQPNGISVGAIRTTHVKYNELYACPACGHKIIEGGYHECMGSTTEYYSPVAKLTPPKSPKRVREGGC